MINHVLIRELAAIKDIIVMFSARLLFDKFPNESPCDYQLIKSCV